MQKDTSFSNTFGRYLICTSLQQTTVHAHALLLNTHAMAHHLNYLPTGPCQGISDTVSAAEANKIFYC